MPETLPLVREFLPELNSATLARLSHLITLVRTWNERVNLVSRKDVDALEEHHLLHSLLATRVFHPAPGARVADFGTGGGFPGLPLAIIHPDAHFTLVDSIAKKGRAVAAMAEALGLTNVRVEVERAEKVRGRFDYVFGRAVAALPEFLGWAGPRITPGQHGTPANGVLYFKGTRWREELAGTGVEPDALWSLHHYVPRPFFAEKFLLHFRAPIERARIP